MNPRSLLHVLALPLAFASALWADDKAQTPLPKHTIPGSELRVLPRNAAGRQYQLHIGLPARYAKNPQAKYPVVYVTDGYWDFAKITAAEGSLVYDKVVPEYISVGIGYAGEDLDYGKLRTWELSPISISWDPPNSGHSREFLETIEKEIIPLIEREYRADPSFRVLGGASMGGLFTLYAMYSKPDLFQGYIALTPSVGVVDEWFSQYEETFAKSHHPMNARLFMAVGGNEAVDYMTPILKMNQRISSRKYEGLAYDFRIIEGERHAGMQIEGYVRGLRFVFAPLAPEGGPSAKP